MSPVYLICFFERQFFLPCLSVYVSV
jgi:hypothetical protein